MNVTVGPYEMDAYQQQTQAKWSPEEYKVWLNHQEPSVKERLVRVLGRKFGEPIDGTGGASGTKFLE